MKKSKRTEQRIIIGYVMKHQQAGGFKIQEFSHTKSNRVIKKRTIHRDLDINTADSFMYTLESKLNN